MVSTFVLRARNILTAIDGDVGVVFFISDVPTPNNSGVVIFPHHADGDLQTDRTTKKELFLLVLLAVLLLHFISPWGSGDEDTFQLWS